MGVLPCRDLIPGRKGQARGLPVRCTPVHAHAVGGGSLAAVAGDSIAVINMWVLPDVELYFLTGVQSNLKTSLGVDLLDGSELAIGNVFLPVRRGELQAVAGCEVAFRFPVNAHTVEPVRVPGGTPFGRICGAERPSARAERRSALRPTSATLCLLTNLVDRSMLEL